MDAKLMRREALTDDEQRAARAARPRSLFVEEYESAGRSRKKDLPRRASRGASASSQNTQTPPTRRRLYELGSGEDLDEKIQFLQAACKEMVDGGRLTRDERAKVTGVFVAAADPRARPRGLPNSLLHHVPDGAPWV